MTCAPLVPTPSVCGNYNRKGASASSGDGLATWVSKSASSPVGSLANLIPLQESVRRLLTIVTCGPNLPVSFARFARDGSSQRMFPAFCTPSLDGSLVAFSGTWPTWGIARDGACGELPTLERCTAGSESLSWPTPRTSDTNGAGLHGDGGMDLRTAVTMWPTPTANCIDMDTMERSRTAGYVRKAMKEAGQPYQTKVSGVLNPTWVEWLMGFPLGWTALEPSEMPSSLNKRTRSSKR